jgi:hypothetical protein
MSPEGKTPKDDKVKTPDKSPEEIQKEIEDTRAELGETVAAVAEATDVKRQAQAKVADVKAQASAKADEAKAKAREFGNPKPLAIAGGVLALALLWRLIRR